MIFKRTIFILISIISLSFVSCDQKLYAPENTQLFAKHIIFDEKLSAQIIDTTDARDFTEREECHVEFKLFNKLYKSEFSLILYHDGTLHRFIKYCVDEPEIYSVFKLDTLSIDGSKISIKFSKSRAEIIDGNDTLNILKIYPNEKLILAGNQKFHKRIIFYEYKQSNFELKENPPD